MKITAIKRQKRSNKRVNVYFGDTRISLAAEVAMAARLRVGADLAESEVAALQGEEAAWRCKEMALTLLSYRPRSHRELRDRLLRRTVPIEVVDACLGELTRVKLLDDDAFGLAWCLDRLRSRPIGRSRMIAELRAKGLEPEKAEDAVRRAFEEVAVQEIDLARRAARKFRRRPGEDPLRARRRLYGFLARRGFSREAAGGVLEEILGEE